MQKTTYRMTDEEVYAMLAQTSLEVFHASHNTNERANGRTT